MFIVLPKKRDGLEEVLSGLDGRTLLEIVQNRRRSDVIVRKVSRDKSINRFHLQVSIPKFKLESTHNLNEMLQKLGVEKAFSTSADFSGIAGDQLYISDVVQKAFIEVSQSAMQGWTRIGPPLSFTHTNTLTRFSTRITPSTSTPTSSPL